jgi:hypothetical protein
MIVTLQNPTTDGLEKTYLAQSYNFGATSIEVKNNQQFTTNQRILIGEMGLASSEVVTTGTVSANGTTIAIGATLYPHEADAPIYLLQFDQAKFYASTTGINGTYNLLPNCPVNIDFTSSDLETTYNDNNAVAGEYYQITVYNSITTVESAFSDPIPAITGWARNQVGYLVDQLYEEISDANEDNLTRDEMFGYLNEVNDDLMMQVVRPYNFLYTRKAFSRVAGSNTLAWPLDSSGDNAMWKFDRMDYNFVDNTTTPVTNTTYTVPVVDIAYFRNRWVNNNSTAVVPTNLTATLAAGGSLVVGTTYYYTVTAVYGAGGQTPGSLEAVTIPITSSQTINLSWSGVPNAAYYNIYRGTFSGGETLLTSTASLTFSDNGTITPSSTYPPTSSNVNDDRVQEMCLDESQHTFNYYPYSLTNSSAVWYLYYWGYFTPITSEGNIIQTPSPKIYKHYVNYKYYLKKSVTDPAYVPVYKQHQGDYVFERARYKSQDRRDAGTPRRFGNEGWVRKSFRR